jgi:hypothetical protein
MNTNTDSAVIFQAIIAPTSKEKNEIIADLEIVFKNAKDFMPVAALFEKQHNKLIKSIGEIKIFLIANDVEARISVELHSEYEQDTIFEDHARTFRDFFLKNIEGVRKVFDISNQIVNENKTPTLEVTNLKSEDLNHVERRDESTVSINNVFSAKLADFLNKQIDQKIDIEVDGATIELPKPAQKILSEKISDKQTIHNFKIRIMSVNSDDAFFRFKKIGDKKLYKGRYDDIETRKKLLLYQYNDEVLNTQFHATLKTGLLSHELTDFELISIIEE